MSNKTNSGCANFGCFAAIALLVAVYWVFNRSTHDRPARDTTPPPDASASGVTDTARTGSLRESPEDSGSPIDKAIAAIERKFRSITPKRPAEMTGIGRVLTYGLVPRKVLAKREGVFLRDDSGYQSRPFRINVPYFVFAEREDQLLIGRLQDHELVERSGGWVQKEDCYPWYSRRLVYPKPDGELAKYVDSRSTASSGIRPFIASSMMPWPILFQNDDSSWTVLCDFRAYGSDQVPLPINDEQKTNFDIYVLFSETELNHALANLTKLAAILQSGKLPIGETPRVLGSFLAQNQVDFVDLTEVKQTLELFPGGSPDMLMKHELEHRRRAIEHWCEEQVAWLTKVCTSTDCYNEEHAVYLVPLHSIETSLRPK